MLLRSTVLFLVTLCLGLSSLRAASREERNVSYLEGGALASADAYRRSQCQLDLRVPDQPGFATVIWFHGGGLTGGQRAFPELKTTNLALVAVSYRLSPAAEHPAYLEDAAAAVAWTLRHIAERGGDPRKVFVAGHSAGGYLAAMIGMDPRWLAAEGRNPHELAGLILVSAQVSTHFLVKKLRGDTGPELRPIIDEFAPLFHVAKDLPPICCILGDRKIEYKNRVEENALFVTALRNLGHRLVEFHEMGGLDHGTVVDGAWVLMPAFIQRALAAQAPATR